MNTLTIIWSMAAAAALTLGGIQLAVWLWDRKAWASLCFFFAACATAATSVVEMAMAGSETPEQYGAVARWAIVPLWLLAVSLIYFVKFLFHAGRMSIAYLTIGIWSLALVVTFLPVGNIGFTGPSGIHHGYWLDGSVYHVAEGGISFWSLLCYAGTLVAVIFVADASASIWRRGERRRALLVGGSIVFFFLLASSQSILIEAGLLEMPYMVSLAFLFIVTALGGELSYGLLNATRISRNLKKSEAELRESEARLSMAAESAGVGLWNFDLRTQEYWVTDKAREMYGFAPDEIATPELFNSRVHKDDIERVLRMGDLNEPPQDGSVEFRMILPDGRLRWISSRGRFHYDQSGNPLRLTGVSIDITERKLVEEEAAERLRFETMLADLSAGFLNISADLVDDKIEDAQRRVCECLDLDISTLWRTSEDRPEVYQLTNLYRPLGGPDVPEPLEAQEYFPWELSQLVAGKTMAFSSVENAPPEAAKDKESWRQFEIKSVLDIPLVTDSGAVLGFLTFAATREERDWPEVITKQLQLVAQVFLNVLLRKRAEQTLHESKELLDIQKRRLSEAQRIAHLGSWTFDKATGATTWSEELYRMTGLERTNGDLTREARRSRFTEDSLARLDEAMATARANEGSFEVEAEMIRSNGEHFSATCRGEPLRDGDGKVIGFHGTIQDTTERKSFEQKLYELSGRLLNLQDEERRTIARNLHDQTAQNLALLNINLALLQKLIPSDKEDINNLVDQSFQLIKQSLKEVRTLSYLLHPPMLDEGGLIAALRWYIGGFSKRSSIVVRFEPDELCEKLPGEIEDTLYRVVQESLSNIHLHSGSKTADVELKCDGSRVVLRIADSGHGFPAPVDISRRDDYRFLGMGLMGMRQRVCQHGGDLKIESDKSGTRITAQIPLRGAA